MKHELVLRKYTILPVHKRIVIFSSRLNIVCFIWLISNFPYFCTEPIFLLFDVPYPIQSFNRLKIKEMTRNKTKQCNNGILECDSHTDSRASSHRLMSDYILDVATTRPRCVAFPLASLFDDR